MQNRCFYHYSTNARHQQQLYQRSFETLTDRKKQTTQFITGPPTYSVGASIVLLYGACRRLSSSVTLHDGTYAT